jgi:hypothetical protein
MFDFYWTLLYTNQPSTKGVRHSFSLLEICDKVERWKCVLKSVMANSQNLYQMPNEYHKKWDIPEFEKKIASNILWITEEEES